MGGLGLLCILWGITNALASGVPATLRATGFFESDVEKFTPAYTLWSDGLEKERHVRLPTGAVIDNSDPENFLFPDGTAFWKTFFGGSTSGRRVPIETRYMKKNSDQWTFLSYRWNAEGTDARLASENGETDVWDFGDGTSHAIPARFDCRECHDGGRDPVLGFTGLNLSPAENVSSSLTLAALARQGRLSTPYATWPSIPARSSLERQAIGTLVANCASCHRPSGRASFTGLFFQFVPDTALEKLPIFETAVRQETGFPIPGHERDSYRILPGDPDRSAVLYRMSSRVPGDAMPSLGTVRPPKESAELVRDWIRSLPALSVHVGPRGRPARFRREAR